MGIAVNEQNEIGKVAIQCGEWPAYVAVYAFKKACCMV
jgi:hypothetical protein